MTSQNLKKKKQLLLDQGLRLMQVLGTWVESLIYCRAWAWVVQEGEGCLTSPV